MFRFGASNMLYLLLVIPVMAALYFAAAGAYRRRLRLFGERATVSVLMPDASPRRRMNKFIIYLVALSLLIVALARPQLGSKLREETRSGIEMMLAVDVSNSMLAQDFEPTRLDRTKHAINRLLGEMNQDRVGLIVFAGDAYVQLPITSDYVTARNFVSHVSPNMVTKQGTAIGAAIDLASRSFSSDSEGSRVMIIISDGENHEDDAVAAAEAAAGKGIRIYTIGVGTPEGAPVSIGGEFIKDENDNIVVSKLDERTLEEIALTTGGAYIRATNNSMGLAEIVEKINETEKAVFTSDVFEEYNEQYQYPLAAALLLLVVEMLIMNRKNPFFARFSVFKRA